VNLPHLPPDSPEPQLIFCQPCTQPLPVKYQVTEHGYHYQGEYHLRDRSAGTDVDVCFSGNIAVTLISL
jgi:5'-nucleotidase